MTDARSARRPFRSFGEFYPYYLSEHSDRTNRRLHFCGSSLALAIVVAALVLRQPLYLLAALVAGYGFAWVGHFVFERNKPATFRHPLYSYIGDWRMWWDTLRGRIAF